MLLDDINDQSDQSETGCLEPALEESTNDEEPFIETIKKQRKDKNKSQNFFSKL